VVSAGTLSVDRKEFQALREAAGAKASGSVSKTTDYVQSSAAPPDQSYRDRCTVAIAMALRASAREVQESFVAA